MLPAKTLKKRGSIATNSPHIPPQRFYSESPAPSTDMSGLLQQTHHRDQESRQPQLSGAVPDPITCMPPSPPLTRRSTSGSSRTVSSKFQQPSSKPATSPPPVAVPATIPEVVVNNRPTAIATAPPASNVSLKDVRKVGKHLGQNPIDYLIPHGSLPAPVSGYFHPTHDPCSLEPPASMRSDNPDANPVAGIFSNLNFLLESYLTILSSGGSLAVGTGYQSVARKLLERVETLFARDLGVPGIGWADVLEYLRGTRQKPFLCVLPVRGLLARREGVSNNACAPEQQQYGSTRELAESVVAGVMVKPAMTKVEQWLEEVEQVLRATDNDDCCPPPGKDQCLSKEDEDEEDRMVCEIIEGILKNNTEDNQIKNFRRFLEDRPFVAQMKKALTRLYHDNPAESITPPIVALYMLLHPELHSLLRALSNITDSELELINSGRFDAFLDGSTNVVARDEDEEFNTITALDKRLWTVLEGLEDEIEELHTRALVVRRALKSRKELIARKRPSADALVRLSSLAESLPKLGKPEEAEELATKGRYEDDWALNVPTLHLPLTPDDSASNITSNRRRRAERASKLKGDEDDRRKDKERKREKKEAKAKKEEEKSALQPRMSLKEFAIKSGEFGPATILEEIEERSDAGETMLSGGKKRRRKDGESKKDRERSRSRNRSGGSGVAEKDEKKKDKDDGGERRERKHREEKKERRERREERSEKDSKEEKKEKGGSTMGGNKPS